MNQLQIQIFSILHETRDIYDIVENIKKNMYRAVRLLDISFCFAWGARPLLLIHGLLCVAGGAINSFSQFFLALDPSRSPKRTF